VVPEGFGVRGVAGPEEADRRASAEREVWLPATVGDIDGGDYALLMSLPGYEPELDVVAVASDGAIAAYVNCWLDPINRIGDFGPVGALPAYRRRGLTRAVLLEGMRRLQAAGMERACVSTGVSNAPARALYESVGFRVVNGYRDYVR
jgi:ribosomal protein S18 acetylase RimI-like enzyme